MNRYIGLDLIREKLADRNLQVVARGADLHPNSLYRIRNGASNPKYKTVQRLVEYFDRQEALTENKR